LAPKISSTNAATHYCVATIGKYSYKNGWMMHLVPLKFWKKKKFKKKFKKYRRFYSKKNQGAKKIKFISKNI
jgi:hypothetical protein